MRFTAAPDGSLRNIKSAAPADFVLWVRLGTEAMAREAEAFAKGAGHDCPLAEGLTNEAARIRERSEVSGWRIMRTIRTGQALPPIPLGCDMAITAIMDGRPVQVR